MNLNIYTQSKNNKIKLFDVSLHNLFIKYKVVRCKNSHKSLTETDCFTRDLQT